MKLGRLQKQRGNALLVTIDPKMVEAWKVNFPNLAFELFLVFTHSPTLLLHWEKELSLDRVEVIFH